MQACLLPSCIAAATACCAGLPHKAVRRLAILWHASALHEASHGAAMENAVVGCVVKRVLWSRLRGVGNGGASGEQRRGVWAAAQAGGDASVQLERGGACKTERGD